MTVDRYPLATAGQTSEGTIPVPTLLQVEPVDTDGRLLRLQCSPTPHLAVASRIVGFEDPATGWSTDVQLDILSASHRVLVGQNGSHDVCETVACDESDTPAPEIGRSGHLPENHRWQTTEWDLWFESSIDLGDKAVAAAALEVRAIESAPNALVARFPGHPLALTALEAVATEAGHLTWRSWHLYPGAPSTDPHVVTTRTTATPMFADPTSPRKNAR